MFGCLIASWFSNLSRSRWRSAVRTPLRLRRITLGVRVSRCQETRMTQRNGRISRHVPHTCAGAGSHVIERPSRYRSTRHHFEMHPPSRGQARRVDDSDKFDTQCDHVAVGDEPPWNYGNRATRLSHESRGSHLWSGTCRSCRNDDVGRFYWLLDSLNRSRLSPNHPVEKARFGRIKSL